MTEKGKHVWIEGTDATGKSTQIALLRDRLLTEAGIDSIEFHEPDGVPIARELRDIIKNGSLERQPFTNVLLFSASRGENWHQEGKLALSVGKWVLNARSYWSTQAYQGYGEGIDPVIIDTITELATDKEYMNPDYAVILDLNDEEERARRIIDRGPLVNPDTFESKSDDFQRKVQNGYRSIAKKLNIPVIDASQNEQLVHEQIWEIINQNLLETNAN